MRRVQIFSASLLAATAALAIAGALPAAAASGSSYIYNSPYIIADAQFRVVGLDGGSTLAVRARPRKYSRKISSIPFNARGLVRIGSRRNGRWLKVRYQGETGWVKRGKLARDDGGQVYFRTAGLGRNGALQIHARPRHRSRERGSIANNTKFIVDLGECTGKWCKVSYQGVRGWVERHCLISMRRTDAPKYLSGADDYGTYSRRNRHNRYNRHGRYNRYGNTNDAYGSQYGNSWKNRGRRSSTYAPTRRSYRRSNQRAYQSINNYGSNY